VRYPGYKLIFFLLFALPLSAGIKDFQVIQAALEAYGSGNYKKSIVLLKSLEKKEEAPIQYNLGNAYYRLKQYKKAILHYRRAKGSGVNEHARLHNLGNAYMLEGEFKKAVISYTAALRQADDPDTRYNLLLAKKKLRSKSKRPDRKKKRNKTEKESSQQKKREQKNTRQKKDNQQKQKSATKEKQRKNMPPGSRKKGDKKPDKNMPGGEEKGAPEKMKMKERQERPENRKGDSNRGKYDKKEKKAPEKRPVKKRGDKKNETMQQPDRSDAGTGTGRSLSSKGVQNREIEAKELKRLMKRIKEHKMPTLMYRFGGGKKASRPEMVNPW